MPYQRFAIIVSLVTVCSKTSLIQLHMLGVSSIVLSIPPQSKHADMCCTAVSHHVHIAYKGQVPLCYCMSIHRDIQSAFQCSHYSQICSGAQCFVNLDSLCIHMYIRTYAHMVLVYSDLLPYPDALLNRDQI